MNPMIKAIAIGISIIIVIVLAVSYTKKSSPEKVIPPPISTPSDRDSESEAVRAVSTGISNLQAEQQVLKKDNKSLRETLDSIGIKLTAITDRLTDYASGQEKIPERNIVGVSIDAIDKSEVDTDELGGDIYSDITEPNLIQEPDINQATIVVDALQQYVWHTPVVLVVPNQSNITNTQSPTTKPVQNNEHRNVIPSGAMIPSRTITALVGRIPVDGRVEEAWPFKAVATDMAHVANYYETSVRGMILEGTAVGDYSFKCVRGRIDRINIVLADGRVVTTTSDEDGLG